MTKVLKFISIMAIQISRLSSGKFPEQAIQCHGKISMEVCMKRMIFLLLLFNVQFVLAQSDLMPGGPLDTGTLNAGDVAGEAARNANQISPHQNYSNKQEQQREEELLENRYDVPDEKEQRDFNKNGTQEP
ncbi:MAG: hypothetical protein ACJ76H_15810 [Bacteriovoracaceae bacterium]